MTAPVEIGIGTLVERKPGVYGGRPVLKGTRFPILLIGTLVQQGWDAERIHAEYLADRDIGLLYAGLAYYHANRAAIDAEIEEEARLYDKAATAHRRAHPELYPSRGEHERMADARIDRPNDIDAVWPDVVRLLEALHEHHRSLVGFELVEDWAERQRVLFASPDPGVLLLVASVDGRPVGLLTGRLLRDSSVFRETLLMIDNMYVVPEKRLAGIGRQLLGSAAEWGRSEGATETRLSVVAENADAERFYEREGFTTRALVLTRLLGEDDPTTA